MTLKSLFFRFFLKIDARKDFISCSVEYLHSGGRKALMLKAEGRREERVKRDKVFL
ncbi:MAG: hypothetical protein F6K17_12630 [Okeania sp. SIO3C4]|nr:hypothetical protein [Okeania sp. SIO3B3]NER03393.1 hypothetical protein [Okeania sp. SIO3C4]